MFGPSVTCHLGNLLRVIKRHLQEQRIITEERLLTDNELLARWVGGLYDDFLSQLRPVDRQPIRFLPAAQSFSHTLFFWAQHRDLSIDVFVRCLRPNVLVRTIVWMREPVERFFSTFYYAKYVYKPKANKMRNVTLDDYIEAKFGSMPDWSREVTARTLRSSVFTNWFAGTSASHAHVERGPQLRRLLDDLRPRTLPQPSCLTPRRWPAFVSPHTRARMVSAQAVRARAHVFVGVLELPALSRAALVAFLLPYVGSTSLSVPALHANRNEHNPRAHNRSQARAVRQAVKRNGDARFYREAVMQLSRHATPS